jgi:hypothetical protein
MSERSRPAFKRNRSRLQTSVGRSESDVKKSDWSESDQELSVADIGQYRNTRQERSDVRYRPWPWRVNPRMRQSFYL